MEHILSSLLLALSGNVDNFAVGIAYGVKHLRISVLANLLIAGVSSVGTVISMLAGVAISQVLPNPVANALGSSVLILIGIWGIRETLKSHKQSRKRKQLSSPDELAYTTYIDDPARVDIDKSRSVELKEAWFLALALTINNLAGGIGGGISGLDIPLTTAFTFSASLLAINGGFWVGDSMSFRLSGFWPGILSGVLLIGLGIYEYFVP